MSSFWRRFGAHAPLMRAAALASPDLLRRLADAPDKTFHVYAIRLSALLSTEPEIGPAAVAAALGAGDLNELLQWSWGTVPPRSLATLDRCGYAVQEAEFYSQLRDVLADARLSAMMLSRSGPIRPRDVERVTVMRRLDPELDAAYDTVPVEELAALSWLLHRIRIDGGELDPAWLTKKLRTLTPLTWVQTVHDVALRHPGVPAPWQGSATLRPIESPLALKRTGRSMRNCLGEPHRALRLLRGVDAYYLWQGEEPVAIQLSTLGGGEWEIVESRSPANRQPPASVLEAVQAEFSAAGIRVRTNIIWALSRYFPTEEWG